MHEVPLHDGSKIDVIVEGNGPAILLPANPHSIEGAMAEEMRKWGNDPALGRSLIDGLSDKFQVIAFDYEGHVQSQPKPNTLTPENIAKDFLSVVDAIGVKQFAYYGYSWLALSGLQLAIRTDRLTALIMGGYPPIDGPYKGMLAVTTATHDMAVANLNKSKEPQTEIVENKDKEEFDWNSVEVTLSEGQTRQFVTLYKALQDLDDRAIQQKITCPRLCFAGSEDEIDYSEKWGNVHVSIAKPLIEKKSELEKLGWDVKLLDGLDHTQAMQANHVLPIIKPWLAKFLG